MEEREERLNSIDILANGSMLFRSSMHEAGPSMTSVSMPYAVRCANQYRRPLGAEPRTA